MKILDMTLKEIILTLSAADNNQERSIGKEVIEMANDLLWNAWWNSPQPSLDITQDMVQALFPPTQPGLSAADAQLATIWRKIEGARREMPEVPSLKYFVHNDAIMSTRDNGRPYIYIRALDGLLTPTMGQQEYAIYPRRATSTDGAFLTKRLAQQLDLPASWGPLSK